MDALLDGLTEPQRRATTHVDGPLLMLAGPGSGKTRVVTHRIAHLLRHGVPAWQIAALTFTNKAADEMRGRVESLAPGRGVFMGTFHRFCARLLRRHASSVGLAENFSIYDVADARLILKRACDAAHVELAYTSPDRIGAMISRFKNRLVTAEEVPTVVRQYDEQLAARVYPIYQRLLITANAVDFDDLLLHVACLLREHQSLRAELDGRYRYILVDEYQDTNLAQYAIVRALSIDHPNLSVTGDPDQSIYGWRGADLNNILNFESDYPDVTTVRLEQNYRSTPNILRVADHLIRHNQRRKAKQLFTQLGEGEPVTLKYYADAAAEADDIAAQIAASIQQGQRRGSDFAVFYRMNSLSRSLEHAMHRFGVPYQVVNGTEFYQRKEIKDLLAYLHLINNPASDAALERVINTPTRGIGATTVKRLRHAANERGLPMLEVARAAGMIESIPKRSATVVARFIALYDLLCVKATDSIQTLVEVLMDETGYLEHLTKTERDEVDVDRQANIEEFIAVASEYDQKHPDDGSLDDFLEQIALVSSTDDWQDQQERVALMTLHASKGLEFPCVYIIGVEDDVLPHGRSKENDPNLEEERRLLFVGMTRAQQRLQLSYCQMRGGPGAGSGYGRPWAASPFLMELPTAEMRVVDDSPASHFFDDDPYPDSWDQVDEAPPEEHDVVQCDDWLAGSDEGPPAVDQLPPRKPPSRTPPSRTAEAMPMLRTAAQLTAAAAAPQDLFRTGMAVTHPDHGAGIVVQISGRGLKCVAKVRFDQGTTRSFRVTHAPLVPLDSRAAK